MEDDRVQFSGFVYQNVEKFHEEIDKFNYSGVLLVDMDSYNSDLSECSLYMSVESVSKYKDVLPYDDLLSRISNGFTPICLKSGNRVSVYDLKVDKRLTAM